MFYERNLLELAKSIQARTYRPWKVRFFVVTNPKPREIVAAHLRDRAVHHLIYGRLSPSWEAKFSQYSYACRVGKGPLAATADLRRFLKLHKGESLFSLKMDISNFFQSIDRGILATQLETVPMDDETKYLVDQTLLFDQVSHCQKVGYNWDKLPIHKSLFNVPKGIGLPIGNLTSQFFANIYLNDMDHWLDHERGDYQAIFWQRYVDDFLVIGKDPKKLATLAICFNETLKETLRICLNPTKTQIQPVCRGIDQLGYLHHPTYLRIRDRVKKAAKRISSDICLGPKDVDQKTISQLNSYLGLMKHADTMRLRRSIVGPLTFGGRAYTRYDHDSMHLYGGNRPDSVVPFGF